MNFVENKQLLVDLLKHNEVHVSFVKLNGEMRIMRCTLREEDLPEVPADKERRQVSNSESTIRVFDLEKNEWRSFRVDSINSFVVLNGPVFTKEEV